MFQCIIWGIWTEDYTIGMAKKIRTILLERDWTIKELTKKIGTNWNNLSNKLSHDNFSEKELSNIAALDCDYDGIFSLGIVGRFKKIIYVSEIA